MRTDDIRSLAPSTELRTDVCIIGSGPAGATLATELAGPGLETIVLESGGRRPDEWGESLNEVRNVGAPRIPDQHLVRNRALGGSSWTWWGRSGTFDGFDFERRKWVPQSGWPISREPLQPYFPRSAVHLGLGIADNNEPAIRALAPTATATGDGRLPYIWSYSRDPRNREDAIRLGPALGERDLPGVRCLVNATVTQLEPDPAVRSVRRIEVTGPDGGRRYVRATLVVLCAGGIENARLLLASSRTVTQGLGNEHDLVGRYLMDHPRGPVATLPREGFARMQRLLGPFRTSSATGAIRLYPGFALDPRLQEREQLLNGAAWVEGAVSEDDPLRSLAGLARLRAPISDLRNLLRYAPVAAETVVRTRLQGRSAIRVLSAMNLQVAVEQSPDRDSRITLSTRLDRLGVPIPEIAWRVGEAERRTAERLAVLVSARLRARGLPAPDLEDWVSDPSLPTSLLDAAHPTGTTRMASAAHDGVVDPDCRVHGLDNLYIAGSSVFPTSGHANPTQMIVALAVRLADHLKEQLRTLSPRSLDGASQVPLDEDPVPAPQIDEAGDGRPVVLVTGASGFVGQHLVPRLIEKGYTVRALTSRSAPPCAPHLQHRVHDLRQDDLDFRRDVAGCAAIVHLAAEQREPDDMDRVNGEATAAIARAAEAAGVRVMVYTSSISVYGSPVRTRTDETAALLTADRDVAAEYRVRPALRAYGRSKLPGELALAATAQDVEYVVFRPTVIVDEVKLGEFMGISRAGRVTSGHLWTHAINVEDVTEALIWAVTRSLSRTAPAPGVAVYNLSDEHEPQTFGDLFRAQRSVSSTAAVPPALPRRLIALQGWLQQGGGLPIRLAMGSTSYPADRLHAAGYRHRHGLAALTRRAAARSEAERVARTVTAPR